MLHESDAFIQSLHTGKTFAKMYAEFRPNYPLEVYDKIMSYHLERPDCLPCDQQLAVDVCCGTGQSTLPLTKYFGKVIGTDISKDQVAEVPKDVRNLETVVSSAEDLYFLQSGSVDLVTIATSLHWVNQEKYDGIKITSEMSLKEYVGYIASFHYINLYLREFLKSNILEEIEKSLALRFGYSDAEENIRVETQWNVFMVLGRND